jgi:hypothetical protein
MIEEAVQLVLRRDVQQLTELVAGNPVHSLRVNRERLQPGPAVATPRLSPGRPVECRLLRVRVDPGPGPLQVESSEVRGGCLTYVSEIVMWPWPMGAVDHAGRHVDRWHITDWLDWGCLRHPLDREEIVRVGALFRSSQDRRSHPGSISSGRLWTASEPDILRRPQAYSRYRVPRIPPASRRPLNDKSRCW